MGEKGYKAFDPGLICRGKQYTENTTFEESGNVAACKEGMMHYCQNPFDCLNHYDLVNSDGKFSDFAEVEALGDIKRDGTKSATNKIHIGAKLGLKGFIKAAVDFTIEKTSFEKLELNTKTLEDLPETDSGDSAKIGSSGDYAQIGSSGDYAQIGSSGNSAQIGSSGDSAKIGSSGYYAQIGSSGDYAQIGSSGDSSQIGSSGDSAKIGSSGYYAQIGSSGNSAQIGSSGDSAQIGSSGDSAKIGSSGYSAKIGSSGDYAQIGSSGDSAKIGSSGDYAQIESTGKNAVVMAAGYKSIAKAKIGSWITLAEWIREDGEWIPKCVKTEHVDGTRIKEDVFYRLVDGNFCEVK